MKFCVILFLGGGGINQGFHFFHFLSDAKHHRTTCHKTPKNTGSYGARFCQKQRKSEALQSQTCELVLFWARQLAVPSWGWAFAKFCNSAPVTSVVLLLCQSFHVFMGSWDTGRPVSQAL